MSWTAGLIFVACLLAASLFYFGVQKARQGGSPAAEAKGDDMKE